MHQTLKQETASPPERNLRRQQMAFLRFQEEFNQARPHEALQYETPASRYVGSERRYPAKLPELEYPEGAHLRRVSHHGDVKLDGVQMFVSSLLAWEVVGLLKTGAGSELAGSLLWSADHRLDGFKEITTRTGRHREATAMKEHRFPARIPGPQERDHSLSRNPGR